MGRNEDLLSDSSQLSNISFDESITKSDKHLNSVDNLLSTQEDLYVPNLMSTPMTSVKVSEETLLSESSDNNFSTTSLPSSIRENKSFDISSLNSNVRSCTDFQSFNEDKLSVFTNLRKYDTIDTKNLKNIKTTKSTPKCCCILQFSDIFIYFEFWFLVSLLCLIFHF